MAEIAYGSTVDPLYIKNRDLRSDSGERTETYDICKAVSDIGGTRNVDGVQLIKGLWKIYLRTIASRIEVLSKGISVNGIAITVFDSNPFVRVFDNQHVEKITIKDLPLSMDNEKIKDFLKSQEGLVLKSGIKYGMVRDENGQWSEFKNGDRFVYALAPVIPTIKRDCRIDDHPCRIFHPSQEDECKSCKETGHKTGSINCPALDTSDTILAFKSYENVLSNFYRCDIDWSGETFDSVEHAYQWTKAIELEKHDLAVRIKNAKHAGAAKAISRKGISREEAESWEGHSEKIMRELLKAKAKSCPQFKDTLMQSGTKILAEATGNTLWATGLDVRTTSMTKPDFWPGANLLGMMLMDLRDSLMRHDMLPDQSDLASETHEIESMESDEEKDETLNSPSKSTPEKTEQTQKDQINTEKPSFLKKVSSIFKHPQTNTMDKYITNEKQNKRRHSTTPPKPAEKKAKKDGIHSGEADEIASPDQHKVVLHASPSDEKTCGNTNHKPGNK